MGIKNNIRALTVDAKVEYKTTEITYEGNVVVFKQPSQAVRRQIIEKALAGERIDPVLFNVWSVILLTYDVDGARVFNDTDEESFLNKPAGGFIDVFAEEATKLMGNTVADGSQEV